MADWITLTDTVKAVNQKNSGFTLNENPQTWLNYSQHKPIADKPNRGDRVEVVVNENNWIQSVKIIARGAPQAGQSGPNGRAPAGTERPAAGGSVAGAGSAEGYRRPIEESLSIGRSASIKAAVEFAGYMPTIDPTIEAATERAKLIVEVAKVFAQFVNEPVVRAQNARSGRPAGGATTGSGAPTPSGSSASNGTAQAPPSEPAAPSEPIAPGTVFCARDGKPIETGISFAGGQEWDRAKMIDYTRETYGEPLCANHFQAELRKQNETAGQAAQAAGVSKGMPAA